MTGRGHAGLHGAADERLERSIGRTLGTGVAVAAVLLTGGLVLWILDREPLVSDRLLHAGFIALMMTPVLRVIASIVGFVQKRDWFFTVITLGVLTVLAGGLWMALRQ